MFGQQDGIPFIIFESTECKHFFQVRQKGRGWRDDASLIKPNLSRFGVWIIRAGNHGFVAYRIGYGDLAMIEKVVDHQ